MELVLTLTPTLTPTPTLTLRRSCSTHGWRRPSACHSTQPPAAARAVAQAAARPHRCHQHHPRHAAGRGPSGAMRHPRAARAWAAGAGAASRQRSGCWVIPQGHNAPPCAAPEYGSCASSGGEPGSVRHHTPRRQSGDAWPPATQPLPWVLELASSRVADSSAVGHPQVTSGAAVSRSALGVCWRLPPWRQRSRSRLPPRSSPPTHET